VEGRHQGVSTRRGENGARDLYNYNYHGRLAISPESPLETSVLSVPVRCADPLKNATTFRRKRLTSPSRNSFQWNASLFAHEALVLGFQVVSRRYSLTLLT